VLAPFITSAIKVHGLIRKEFERNRNESRPAVVEVRISSAPAAAVSPACQVLKSNAAAALTHYLFYASSPPALLVVRALTPVADFQQGRQGASCKRIQVRALVFAE
jgi:hypothetical protein